ncbi:MAG: hypothetical protein ACLFUX_07800, partial [Spirochaetaceae bacterium]
GGAVSLSAMGEREPLHIFLIARSDGTSLFLHPFLERQRVMERMEGYPLHGLYGREPRVEAITGLRNELYRLIEEEIRDWIGEARFIPRFLIAAGVFLVVYVGMSLAVRDPVPMVDELGIALGAAVAAFLVRRKREMSSDIALSKRAKLRSKVDGIVFSESDFVKEIEALLHDEEGASADRIVERLSDRWEVEIDPRHRETAKEFVAYLRKKLNTGNYRRQEKRLVAKDRGAMSSRDQQNLRRWAAGKKVDLPLFALYVRLKRHLDKHVIG